MSQERKDLARLPTSRRFQDKARRAASDRRHDDATVVLRAARTMQAPSARRNSSNTVAFALILYTESPTVMQYARYSRILVCTQVIPDRVPEAKTSSLPREDAALRTLTQGSLGRGTDIHEVSSVIRLRPGKYSGDWHIMRGGT